MAAHYGTTACVQRTASRTHVQPHQQRYREPAGAVQHCQQSHCSAAHLPQLVLTPKRTLLGCHPGPTPCATSVHPMCSSARHRSMPAISPAHIYTSYGMMSGHDLAARAGCAHMARRVGRAVPTTWDCHAAADLGTHPRWPYPSVWFTPTVGCGMGQQFSGQPGCGRLPSASGRATAPHCGTAPAAGPQRRHGAQRSQRSLASPSPAAQHPSPQW